MALFARAAASRTQVGRGRRHLAPRPVRAPSTWARVDAELMADALRDAMTRFLLFIVLSHDCSATVWRASRRSGYLGASWWCDRAGGGRPTRAGSSRVRAADGPQDV